MLKWVDGLSTELQNEIYKTAFNEFGMISFETVDFVNFARSVKMVMTPFYVPVGE